jgi:hypothetical protein
MFEDLIKKKVSAEKIIKKIIKDEEINSAERIQKKINKIWGNKGLGTVGKPPQGKKYVSPSMKSGGVKSDVKKLVGSDKLLENLYEKIRRGRDGQSIDSSSTPGR